MKRGAGKGVIQRFLTFLSDNSLAGSESGIAISGGVDSTALAICASEAMRAGVLVPVLLHVDHGVRSNSAADRTIVRRTAESLGLSLIEIDLASLTTRSTEAEMRDARYLALHNAVNNHGINRVMTGHHARDQAETVLLHLVRGQGAEGAAGIHPLERLRFGGVSLEVIRPLLGESPDELQDLVSSRNLAVVSDPSNFALDRARNLIRHQALPILSAVNPAAVLNIARSAEIARAENEFLDQVSRNAIAGKVGQEMMISADLSDHSLAIQRRVLRTWVHGRTGMHLSFDRTEALRELILSGVGGSSLELGDHWTARQHKRRITLYRDDGLTAGDTGVGS